MALQLRLDPRAYVSVADPAAQGADDARAIAGSWVSADGQPDDATRVVVRPMSAMEYAAMGSADTEAARMDAIWAGVVTIDGQPLAWRDLPGAVALSVAGLVVAVSAGVADPLDARS